MAEKEESSSSHPVLDTMYVFAVILILLLLLSQGILSADSTGKWDAYLRGITGGVNGWYANLMTILHGVYVFYSIIATIFCVLVFLAIVYANVRLKQIEAEEEEIDEAPEVGENATEMAAKWQKVLAHVNSENPAEWRLSILEADVMLEEMLDKMSYGGETLGEKLKSVEKSDFKTIEYAWEAHKIRNAIAHEGSDFLITQREAKRVIGLYEKVFQEFFFI